MEVEGQLKQKTAEASQLRNRAADEESVASKLQSQLKELSLRIEQTQSVALPAVQAVLLLFLFLTAMSSACTDCGSTPPSLSTDLSPGSAGIASGARRWRIAPTPATLFRCRSCPLILPGNAASG